MLAAVNHHYIRTSFDHKYPSIFGLTPEQFEQKLLALQAIGTFVSQEEIKNAILTFQPLPEKSLVITFDDGLAEQFELALPILQKHGVPAVFFISSSTLEEARVLNVHKVHLIRSELSPAEMLAALTHFTAEQGITIDQASAKTQGVAHYKYDTPEAAELKYMLNFLLDRVHQDRFVDDLFQKVFSGREAEIHGQLYMNREQIKTLGDLGYLGSHGHDHDPIGLKDVEEQIRQVSKSKALIEAAAEKEIYSFSYPYGAFDACNKMAGVLEEHDFVMAFTMERAVNSTLDNPYYFSRFDNNDMPLGKAYRHASHNIFATLPFNTWQFVE